MTHPTTGDSPAIATARLTLGLHRLLHDGADEGPAGDAVRDELDKYWYALTESETDRIGGLSEDLYTLLEGVKPVAMTESERALWRHQAREALDAGDCDRLLSLLRHPPEGLPAADVYAQQGWCWDKLGVPDVALAFMQAAADRDPKYAAAVQALLWQLGRADDAAGYARRLLGQSADALFPAHATS